MLQREAKRDGAHQEGKGEFRARRYPPHLPQGMKGDDERRDYANSLQSANVRLSFEIE